MGRLRFWPGSDHGPMRYTNTLEAKAQAKAVSRSVLPDRFRNIMSAFPTGVTVITTTDRDSIPRGFTSNAVTSVSLTPPLLLVCVAATSETLPVLRQTRRFVVNFLKSGEDTVSNQFARKGPDKFAGVDYRLHDGLPVLSGHTIAYAVCSTEQEIDAGDHVILLGQVRGGAAIEAPVKPLLYYRSTYPSWPDI
jgi:flavin-dependent trigonelline monooxygenase, reductase component